MTDSLLSVASQFGAAGLIGVLWILERRHSLTRDRQLDEAHRAVLARERQLDALLTVVKDNTSAIIRLEQSQQRLIHLLDRLRHDVTGPGRPPVGEPSPRRARDAVTGG